MSKTVKEWLMELPEVYRERALANMDEKCKNIVVGYMENAIDLAFAWEKSQEGLDFWVEVYNHYFLGKPLPPLPNSSESKHEQAVSHVPTFTKEDLWETWWASAIKTVSFDGPDKEYERRCFEKFYEWKLANTKTP